LKIHHALKETSYLTDGPSLTGFAVIATTIGKYLLAANPGWKGHVPCPPASPARTARAGGGTRTPLMASDFSGNGVAWSRMNSDSSSFLSELWRYKPIVIVLAIGGMILFILLVIDAYRHRKRRKDRHKRLH
jgi:hypothetical protein